MAVKCSKEIAAATRRAHPGQASNLPVWRPLGTRPARPHWPLCHGSAACLVPLPKLLLMAMATWAICQATFRVLSKLQCPHR